MYVSYLTYRIVFLHVLSGKKDNGETMENTLREYTATEARSNFSDVLNQAIFDGPVVIRKGKKHAVAVVTMELLETLLDIEAKLESETATAALKEYDEKGGISLAKLKEQLGLT